MSTTPFPNEYQARLVKDSDAKACAVCYKPASTVLLATNNGDFFYVCPSHLADASFATAIQPQAYLDLAKEQTSLESKVATARSKAEKSKPYAWTSIMNAVGYSKAKPDKKEASPSQAESEGKQTSLNEKQSYEQICAELEGFKKDLQGVKDQIARFQFKKYSLNDDIYKMRVNSHNQGKLRAKRQQKMQDPSFFPSVPSGTPQ